MKQIKVLVVDDSAFMRQTIKAMIEEDPVLQVVATARNGADALEKVIRFKPDVITLDIILPGDRDGLAVLHEIMSTRPTPTIMLSGASNETINYVIEAISSGAFDFICKPSGKPADIARIETELQVKIKQAAESATVRKRTNNAAQVYQREDLSSSGGVQSHSQLIIIGSSTGGPKALQAVIPQLSEHLPAPILIVQHMPPKFTKSLADRLNRYAKLPVKEAVNGEILKKGHVYVAPGGLHLCVSCNEQNHLCVDLSSSPPVNGVRPSIDVTLRSLVQLQGYSFIVALLTGMGKDGAKGILELCEAGKQVHTIAESEETCTVFGMPKAAIETGRVNEIQPIYHIADTICRQFGLRGDD
ncbi:protein-glutamate methylesterase/protein-glutamine glutaminase [Sporolactobacillus terrae]|uniref:protein-glutamate methylesterase/protein-glutamine glutaminase n=1 Tax=Sporolactobacillus terrae TaxID=269673 RepID=UPI00111AB8DB|nr:chemotaxis response regulator protein-glutamate methylesterase [Sporolactobacillus terrae]